MELFNHEPTSSGGLRPPQHQVEYKPSLLIIEFASLVAAEARDLRYYINLLSYILRIVVGSYQYSYKQSLTSLQSP